MSLMDSIVRAGTDYSITDPSDALYDHDSAHPVVQERFEHSLRRNLAAGFYDAETVAMMRRHRTERQEFKARQAREICADVQRARAAA